MRDSAIGHRINALIGPSPVLADLVERLGFPEPIVLALGQVLIPLDGQRLDAILATSAPALDGLAYLTAPMAGEISGSLHGGRILHIQTDYFGGVGDQGRLFSRQGTLLGIDPKWRPRQVG